MTSDGELMDLALTEARKALEHDDVPVGAVVVDPNGVVVASRHNERNLNNDPAGHAEVLALKDAAQRSGSWNLTGHVLVVTLEPCLMCAGAAVNSRVKQIVYGAADPKAGACLSLYNVCDDPRLNHQIELTAGIRQDECAKMLQDFFKAKR